MLATENPSSPLYEEQSKIEKISKHIGCVYSGMGPDARILVKRARKIAIQVRFILFLALVWVILYCLSIFRCKTRL